MLLALAAGITWGISDFFGGLTSRRLALAAVLLVSQVVGAVLLLTVATLHSPLPLEPSLAFAAAGSILGLIGITGLYRGMAVGSISIVAPISATGAVIPVLFGLLRGERASSLQTVGIGLALVGIVLASRAADDTHAATDRPLIASGVGYALLAALGFGGFFVFLHEASVTDVLWAGAVQRVTGVVVIGAVVLVRRTSLRIPRQIWPALLLVGVLDTTANVLYAFASTVGLVSLAAMLASLYPVATVLLARVVLRERMSRTQATGVVCALVGVACIALQ